MANPRCISVTWFYQRFTNYRHGYFYKTLILHTREMNGSQEPFQNIRLKASRYSSGLVPNLFGSDDPSRIYTMMSYTPVDVCHRQTVRRFFEHHSPNRIHFAFTNNITSYQSRVIASIDDRIFTKMALHLITVRYKIPSNNLDRGRVSHGFVHHSIVT